MHLCRAQFLQRILSRKSPGYASKSTHKALITTSSLHDVVKLADEIKDVKELDRLLECVSQYNIIFIIYPCSLALRLHTNGISSTGDRSDPALRSCVCKFA